MEIVGHNTYFCSHRRNRGRVDWRLARQCLGSDRRVSERNQAGAVTFQESEFDGRGRRMKKVVTNSGEYGGTVVYLYDSWKIIETRDGSGKLYQQFIHGTQYIDELVMMRVKDKGDLYVHQDANWNVVALTDLGGSVVERYVYTPYG